MKARSSGRVSRSGMLAGMMAAAASMGTGCEKGDGGVSDREDFIGNWKVTKNDSGSVGYYHFLAVGTYYKTRETVEGPCISPARGPCPTGHSRQPVHESRCRRRRGGGHHQGWHHELGLHRILE